MQFFEIFQKVTILYIRINIRNNIMKYFWWIIFIIILLLIYPIALYAAIKVQDESLESFIILNFGLICLIPHGIQRLICHIKGESDQEEESSKHSEPPKRKLKFRVKFGLYLLAASLICLLLGLFMPVFTHIELIGIFVSVVMIFLIMHFFYSFLPRKLGLDE